MVVAVCSCSLTQQVGPIHRSLYVKFLWTQQRTHKALSLSLEPNSTWPPTSPASAHLSALTCRCKYDKNNYYLSSSSLARWLAGSFIRSPVRSPTRWTRFRRASVAERALGQPAAQSNLWLCAQAHCQPACLIAAYRWLQLAPNRFN